MEERSLQTSPGEAGEHQALVPWMLKELGGAGGGRGIKADSQMSPADDKGGKAGLNVQGGTREMLLYVAFLLPFHFVWTRGNSSMPPSSLQPLVIPAGGRGGAAGGQASALVNTGLRPPGLAQQRAPAGSGQHLPWAMPDTRVPGAWPLTRELLPNQMGRRQTAKAASHGPRSGTGGLA